ncbi:hypothetical protein HJC23_001709 [Cyclotella cryptica]|uniref:Uncharacterized protein n=1 Tax=Cyclotella cryptica TaxID=29204 RepID=A0ABD3NQS9_9STRA
MINRARFAILDGESKYAKKTPPTARTRSFLWTLLFPAAATVTTDVWFHTAPLSSNFSYGLILAIINVSGAFLDGFFSAFENGDAVPIGPKTEALHLVAEEVRTFGLSTYTSWAGMVNVAASMGIARSNFAVGLLYILMCIGCGFVAHGLGSDFAQYVSPSDLLLDGTINASYSPIPRANKIVDRTILVLTLYILTTYIFIELTEPQQKFWAEESPSNQLVVSIFFAVGGAYTGNIVSKLAPENSQIPMGTILCNATFSLLSLLLNRLQTYYRSPSESLVLKALSINFCGAASIFSRHISGLSLLYTMSLKRSRLVFLNVSINLLFATMIYWIALVIESLPQHPGEGYSVIDSKADTQST